MLQTSRRFATQVRRLGRASKTFYIPGDDLTICEALRSIDGLTTTDEPPPNYVSALQCWNPGVRLYRRSPQKLIVWKPVEGPGSSIARVDIRIKRVGSHMVVPTLTPGRNRLLWGRIILVVIANTAMWTLSDMSLFVFLAVAGLVLFALALEYVTNAGRRKTRPVVERLLAAVAGALVPLAVPASSERAWSPISTTCW